MPVAAQETLTSILRGQEWMSESAVAGTLIENVLLCGNKSRNGYLIPPSAFGDEARVKQLYEGRHVFVNHLPLNSETHVSNRDIEDLAGYVKNVRLVEGKPRGDIETAGAPKGNTLRDLVEAKYPEIGLSHTAYYEMDHSDEAGPFVRVVEQVHSVDVVTSPATTKGFHENVNPDERKNKHMSDEILRDELKTAREKVSALEAENGELKTKLAASEAAKTELDAKNVTLATESKALKSRVDEFEMAAALVERREAVAAELKAAELDPADKDVCSDLFIESLVNEEDTAVRGKLIADRKSLVAKIVTEHKPGGSDERKPPSTEAYKAETDLERADLFA